jgi:hypothetical protein
MLLPSRHSPGNPYQMLICPLCSIEQKIPPLPVFSCNSINAKPVPMELHQRRQRHYSSRRWQLLLTRALSHWLKSGPWWRIRGHWKACKHRDSEFVQGNDTNNWPYDRLTAPFCTKSGSEVKDTISLADYFAVCGVGV